MNRTGTLLLVVVIAGCGNVTYRTLNMNFGQQGNLTFMPVGYATPMTGAPVRLEVTRGDSGQFQCVSPAICLHINQNPCSDTCTFIGKKLKVEKLLDASCGTNCAATIDGNIVSVSATQSGRFTLTVKAQLDDQSVVDDSTSLDFRSADHIDLTCGAASVCPGARAVVAGTLLELRAFAADDAGWLGNRLVPTAVPEGIVAANADGSLRALDAGAVTLTWQAGALQRSHSLYVVSEADVVSGELHTARAPDGGVAYSIDWLIDDPLGDYVGPPAPTQAYEHDAYRLPVWTLTDGGSAVSSAKLVQTSTPGMAMLFENVPAPMMFQVYQVQSCTRQPVRLTATVGAVLLDWTYNQLCP